MSKNNNSEAIRPKGLNQDVYPDRQEPEVYYLFAKPGKLSDALIQELFPRYYPPLVSWLHGSFRRYSMFADDIATDAFSSFWEYRGEILEQDVWQALQRCGRNVAISLQRKEMTLKRGGGRTVSLEALRSVGFEPASGQVMFSGRMIAPQRVSDSTLDAGSSCADTESPDSPEAASNSSDTPDDYGDTALPKALPAYADPEQIESLQYRHQLDLVDRTIAKARAEGTLREKDEALVRVMRESAPDELTDRETWAELTPFERRLFYPHWEPGDQMADTFFSRVVGRAKERLQKKLYKIYVGMGFSER